MTAPVRGRFAESFGPVEGMGKMKKDVLVTVSGLQMMPDGDDTIEVTTAGTLYEKNGKRFLLYDEIGDDADLVIRNTIEIFPRRVEVRKRGVISAIMCFEEKQKLRCVYDTPYGRMELGIYTRSIDIHDSQDVFELSLDYRLEINNEHISDSRIRIHAEAAAL